MGVADVDAVPVSDRIDSARMSHTRLRAMEKPEVAPALEGPNLAALAVKEDKSLLSRTTAENSEGTPEPIAVVAPDQIELKPFVPQGKRGATKLANVSHYRLAAYVAHLDPEEQKKVVGEC